MNDGIRNGILFVIAMALSLLVSATSEIASELHRARLVSEHPPTVHVFVEPSPPLHGRVVP